MSIVWNAQRVSAGLDEIEIARPVLFDRVKKLLDEYHGVQRSMRHYDILLGDFLERYLHLVYVAMQDLKDEIESLEKIGDNPKDILEVDFRIIRTTLEFFLDYAKSPMLAARTLRALAKSGANGVSVSTDSLTLKNSASSGRRDKIISRLLRSIRSAKSTRVLFVRPFSGRIPVSWIGAMVQWRA